jgi:hypothetical protein
MFTTSLLHRESRRSQQQLPLATDDAIATFTCGPCRSKTSLLHRTYQTLTRNAIHLVSLLEILSSPQARKCHSSPFHLSSVSRSTDKFCTTRDLRTGEHCLIHIAASFSAARKSTPSSIMSGTIFGPEYSMHTTCS